MSKFTVVGDIHCKLENLDKVKLLFEIIESLGNPTILLGDLLDTKDLVRARCLNLYYECFSKSKLEFTVLVGNHDLINIDRKDHALTPLCALKNVTIVDEPYISTNYLFLPYNKSLSELSESVIHAKESEIKFIFGHLDIQNFNYGNGIISQEGFKLEDFKGFKRVLLGHYHCFQTKDNLTYLGTPFSHSFGESDQTKYIGILDIEINQLELLETPFPKHRTFEINCDAVTPNSLEFKDLMENSFKINMNDYNRIILSGSSYNISQVQRQAGIKYIEKPTISKVQKFNIDETLTHEQQFRKWSELIKKYDGKTLELGMEILKNV
jgi:DNA repair exonuclease SbcCD nuclease subunit